jgi:hypothetical protein
LQRAGFIGPIAATWIIALVAPLSWAGQRPPGEFQSGPQSVTLVAHLPNTVGVGAHITPVPQTLLESGQTADMVVLQESWTFARGETFVAECQVTTEPQATATLFTSKPQDPQELAASFASPASFLAGRQVRTFSLVTGFDSAKGSQWDTQILLIARSGSGDNAASVRITVVAL